MSPRERLRATAGRLGVALVLAAALGALAALGAGLGHRWDLWAFPTGFAILRWAVFFCIGVAAVAACTLIVAVWVRAWRALVAAAVALALAAGTVWVPVNHLEAARRLPPIHDITTDIDDPPRFVDILPLRRDAPNPARYGGSRVAAQQLKAYPDLGPITYDLPPEQVFDRVLKAVEDLGWSVVAADPAAGRIEAVDRTFWFGFTDDIVIRVAPHPAQPGTRVDIRSVSRVGVSDLGTNARRIRAFLRKIVAGSKP